MLLPDCECKGRAFPHSLQDFAEKKCEKISFATILPLHSIAKSAVKPIFPPLPHPSFFARNLRFSRFSPFRTRFRAIFRGNALVFCPVKSTFFSSFLVLEPTSSDFSRERPRFFPFYRLFPFPFSHFESNFRRFFDGTSLFSAPNFNFSLLFPVLPHASGTSSKDLTHYFLRTPLFAQREGFFLFRLHLHLFPTPPSSPDLLPFRPSYPLTFTPPPLSFSFLPTFPSSSPINARSRAPSRNTRVRVRPHVSARQEIFVYSLHLFTYPSQSTGHQCVRCEGKQEKAFTMCTTASQSRH